MFKLTNGQASAFNSPVIGKLFNDVNREFPTETAFKLTVLVQEIQNKMKVYQDQIRKIIEDHQGTIAPNGIIQYINPEAGQKAQEKINELNSIELEYTGEKVKMTPDWPKLSLAEATILQPLIVMGSDDDGTDKGREKTNQ